jgi:hypothetical protein
METKARYKGLKMPKAGQGLPIIHDSYSFEGYDAELLMNKTRKLRELTTKRRTLEILIPLCCKYLQVDFYFRSTLVSLCKNSMHPAISG